MADTTSSAEGAVHMNTTTTEPLVGVINAGSSSVKFSFYEGERPILTGQVRDRRTSLCECQRARWRKIAAAGSWCEAAERAERGIADHLALGKRQTRRPQTCGGRPPRGPRRTALFPAGARHSRIVGRA